MTYYPAAPPDLTPASQYARRELEKLAGEIKAPKTLQLTVSHTAPAKPRDGMITLADGTDWNPGSGAGFYGYYGSAWNKLG